MSSAFMSRIRRTHSSSVRLIMHGSSLSVSNAGAIPRYAHTHSNVRGENAQFISEKSLP